MKLLNIFIKNRSRLSITLLIVLLAITALAIWKLKEQKRLIDQNIAQNKLRISNADILDITPTPITQLDLPLFKLYHQQIAVSDLIYYQGSYFAATEGGLIEFNDQGKRKNQYTSLEVLPTNELSALADYQHELFIGTSNGKLCSFSNGHFIDYRFKQPPQRITNLFSSNDQLLIGSSGLGAISYNGKQFAALRGVIAPKAIITAINETANADYYGTFEHGLYIKQAGNWQHTTINEGLPSNRVVSITPFNDQIYIGTDFGIATIEANNNAINGDKIKATQIAQLPGLSDLIAYHNRLFICKDDGSIFTATPSSNNISNRSQLLLTPIEKHWPQTRHCRFKIIEDKLFLLTSAGIWLLNSNKTQSQFQRFDQTSDQTISANMISALALDSNNRLWIGFFNRGLDIISLEGNLIKHLETEAIREINCLRWNSETNRMLVATSAGLFDFDLQLRSNQINNKIDTKQGILSNSISNIGFALSGTLNPYHKAILQDQASLENHSLIALATARGLSIGTPAGFQNFTTLQGLPSNSVYALANLGNKLFVGTLGGLAVIEGGHIIRTYKQSNSSLSANWISSLATVDDKLFIGTYGGGIDLLLPSGELRSLQSQLGKFEVNINAINADANNVFIGTLNSGIKILNQSNQQWLQLKSGLPSPNVMAIASNTKYIFVGTEQGLVRIDRAYLKDLAQQSER